MNWDIVLTLWFNQWHSPTIDPWMIALTDEKTWIPLFIVWLVYFIRLYKKGIFKLLLIVAMQITITDVLSSRVLKPYWKRQRPCNYLPVHEPGNLCRPSYAMPSSHATNSFGLATLLTRYANAKNIIFSFWLWALVFSYTRIYLGLHHVADILVGALLGSSIGFLLSALWDKSGLLEGK